MNEDAPLKLTMRLGLEAIADGLSVAVAGVAVLNLADPWRVAVPFALAILLAVDRRLLGQKQNSTITILTTARDQLAVENTVLSAEATAPVRKAATEAAAAIKPAPVPDPVVKP